MNDPEKQSSLDSEKVMWGLTITVITWLAVFVTLLVSWWI
jgi:hypothetical protein